MSVPMATSLGFDSYTANVGSMRNTGIEVSLGADIFRSNDFSWRFTLLASTVKNEILKLVNGQDIIGGSRIHREGETTMHISSRIQWIHITVIYTIQQFSPQRISSQYK